MSHEQSVAIIIPARYASTRFPGKPLISIAGKTMIQRVWEQAKQSKLAKHVIVATDDQRIADAVRAFGGEVRMTSDKHESGTDRLAEVANSLREVGIIVNVQGDEPLISPLVIDAAIKPLIADRSVEMSTVAYPVKDDEKWQSPQLVKVVTDRQGFALYFSRHPIPFLRDPGEGARAPRLGHAGLYVYRKECLAKLAGLAPTPLEQTEKLEQLRALENGIKIKVVVHEHNSPGVDVPEDIAKVEALLAVPHVVPVVGSGAL
ncbi:MAG: 3-deoxy-manno-octulosonate cytidylyltransferase [Candidatus Obscuribacterales bacterium]|nr:3-deoxy-manno-octulosonate cytidylyltransferase [Candidatus Obscuribacterales bacterium]